VERPKVGKDAHLLTKIALVYRLGPVGRGMHTDWTVWWPGFLGGNFASIFFCRMLGLRIMQVACLADCWAFGGASLGRMQGERVLSFRSTVLMDLKKFNTIFENKI
jgi:hypothetical protein